MMEIEQESDWSFDSGRLPLDFANTALWHAGAHPQELLERYADLVAWSEGAGLLSVEETLDLLVEAENRPAEASAALGKAIALRESLYRIFSALAAGEELASAEIVYFNQVLNESLVRAQVVPTSKGFEWGWVPGKGALERMLWPITHSTAELLISEDIDRVGECADDRGCGYVFLDTSRNRSRRWCSMESCGNRAKARRHYRRQAQGKGNNE